MSTLLCGISVLPDLLGREGAFVTVPGDSTPVYPLTYTRPLPVTGGVERLGEGLPLGGGPVWGDPRCCLL